MSSPKRKPEEKAEDYGPPHKRALEAHMAELKRLEAQHRDVLVQMRDRESLSADLERAALYEEVLLQRDATPLGGGVVERLVHMAHAVHTFLYSDVVNAMNVKCELTFGNNIERDMTIDVTYMRIPNGQCVRVIDLDGEVKAYGQVKGNVRVTPPDMWHDFF